MPWTTCREAFYVTSVPLKRWWALACDDRSHGLRIGPTTVVKSVSAFLCVGTNRESANRPQDLSRLIFTRKGAKIIYSPGWMHLRWRKE